MVRLPAHTRPKCDAVSASGALRSLQGKGIVNRITVRMPYRRSLARFELSYVVRFVRLCRHHSKRQRALRVPPANASMKTFTPDSSIASDVIPSVNYGDRAKGRLPDMILLHYTGMPDVEGAIARLCTAGTDVSAHYIVLEDGRIVQCVPEAKRAWHAGVASWAGEEDINSCSIGVEIVDRGHDWGYPEFPLRQTAAVIALCAASCCAAMCRRIACSRIRMSRPPARRTPAKNFRGIRWPIPASAIGYSRRRSCAAKRSSSAPSTMMSPICRPHWPDMVTAFPSTANMTPRPWKS